MAEMRSGGRFGPSGRGTAGTGGDFFLSGSGTVGPDPVLGVLGLLGIVPDQEVTVGSAFFEAGSNTTTMTFGNVVLSLVPGVTSSYTVDLDIDGAMSSFVVDWTFANSRPGAIQLQSVAHLGQDVVIDVTQNGSNWLFEVSSVPEPSILMLLALPAVLFATGRFVRRMRNE